MRQSLPLSLLVGSIISVAHAFVVVPSPNSQHHVVATVQVHVTKTSPRTNSLARHLSAMAFMTKDGRDETEEAPAPPIECYLVTDQAVVAEGEPPKIVCTSEPEEYAWFNGIDPKKLHKTDVVSELSTECVEGASPRGIPEWECK